jgi:hypothetical protein
MIKFDKYILKCLRIYYLNEYYLCKDKINY